MTRPRHVLDAVLDGVADPATQPEQTRKRLGSIQPGEPPVHRPPREELNATRAAYKAIYNVLDPLNGFGGIYKRIDEIREITEAIRDYWPELFQQVYGLIYWLDASDQFLCRLRDTAMPEGSSPQHDEQRVFWQGTGRTNHIYDNILSR